MSDKVIISCALTGVLTNPAQFPVPVTPEQMAKEARAAFDAGASVMHVHVRDQRPGMGMLPSWNPDDFTAVCDAIRAACPGVLINLTTGMVGPNISGPLACLERVKPEMAAMNAGSLNYLRTTKDGKWAWQPMLFDNPVDKIQKFLDVMYKIGILPECECFDVGIVRSVGLFQQVGMLKGHIDASIIMGVASGLPANPAYLPLVVEELPKGATWQVIGIGREEVWPCHQKAAELGGNLRTGLEDTFYLPNGDRASSNGQLVEAIAKIARALGREPATPAETRQLLHIKAN